VKHLDEAESQEEKKAGFESAWLCDKVMKSTRVEQQKL
jgi:hypothetical protein